MVEAERNIKRWHGKVNAIMPLRMDGTKAPILKNCLSLYERPTPWTVALVHWGRKLNAGVGIITGEINNNLEGLDFERRDVFDEWSISFRHILERLPIVATGGGGIHVYYRCKVISGHRKIAMEEVDGSLKTLIESRGTHGYLVAPGNPAKIHKSGIPYVQLSGPPIGETPFIAPEIREVFWDRAATFSCPSAKALKVIEAAKKIKELKRLSSTSGFECSYFSVGENFNARKRWEDIMPTGWHYSGGYWVHPRSTNGRTATIVEVSGTELLHIHGSTCDPFETGRNYDKFAVYTLLHHNGNRKQAAKKLASEGWAA